MDSCLSLTLRNTPTEVDRLNREFGAFAEAHRLPIEVRHSMNLALEEIVTNVIRHGYRNGEDQGITIEVTLRPDEISALVEDASAPFNSLELPPPDVSVPLEQRRPGGLGIHLARNLLDGLTYSRIGGRNRLELRKDLSPNRGSTMGERAPDGE